jgi:aldehyde dehydrogenase (NAD+)
MRDDYDFDRDWQLLVDGAFRDADDGERLQVADPATGEVFATAPDGTEADVDDAVDAANAASDEWKWTDPADRASALYEIADAIEDHHDELVALETRENGKPLDQSVNDVVAAAKTFRYYAGGADKFFSDTVEHSPEQVRQKVFEPYGVVGVIVPWNWPPMHTADFVAPALAAGNTVVLKPAPDTPLSSLRIAELAADSLPDGALNVVSGGIDPGIRLTSHEDVDMLTFTGSDKNGEKVLAAAAENITPTMMELGGKNPAIVFEDADMDKTIGGVIASTFYNSGQACSDAERILVQESVYEEVTSKLADALEALVVGDGFDEATQIGPMANEAQVEKFEQYLDIAQGEGATILAQAEPPSDSALDGGNWVAPTLLDDVVQDSRFACEEVFGPVAGIIPFSDEAEAIEIANAVDYGLTATIWTDDVSKAHRVASHVEAGQVAVNATGGGGLGLPFGGYKRSGVGRKKDFTETMREFSTVKAIRIDTTDDRPSL